MQGGRDVNDGVRWHRVYVAALIFGVVVRVLAAVLTTNSQDLALFGLIVQQGGQGHSLYSDPGFTYPPLAGYALLAFGKLLAAAGAPVIVHAAALQPYRLPGLAGADLTTPIASLLIKTPAMLGDVAAAWAIDAFCRRCGVADVRRRAAVLAWWLNPIVLFDSAVQASWDSIVPAAIVASGLAALDRKPFVSGAWLAIGALCKLVPALCVPLVATTVFFRERDARARARAVLAFVFGGVLMALLALGPLAARGEFSTFVHDTILTRSGGAAFGGFNVWSALQITSLRALNVWVQDHGPALAFGLLLFEALAIAGVSVVLARSPQIDAGRWSLGALVTVCVVLLAAPYAQPGYAVWLIPFCLLEWARGSRAWGAAALALSVCSFAFAFVVRAPAALIIPACWFYRLCDPVAMQQATYFYGYATGTFTPLVQLDRDVAFGLAAAIIVIAIAVLGARGLVGARRA